LRHGDQGPLTTLSGRRVLRWRGEQQAPRQAVNTAGMPVHLPVRLRRKVMSLATMNQVIDIQGLIGWRPT